MFFNGFTTGIYFENTCSLLIENMEKLTDFLGGT